MGRRRGDDDGDGGGRERRGAPGPEIWVRGPVDLPEDPDPVALPQAEPRRYSWVGTHGGAGVSTLATVYGGHDCGRDWPAPDAPRSVLLVARTHASGLASLLRTLEMFRRGQVPAGLDLDGVALVADGQGRLPRPLERQARLIEATVDAYRVPWVTAWRLGDLSGTPPRETTALARLTGTPTRGR
ncbi:hypothetical protein ACIQJX_25530 [Streptomyces griseoviridis]|uniref:hypothetical protein n=1 Tax=Streptomyces griseoviridis TaxID=45398 RepID=UPI00341C02FA